MKLTIPQSDLSKALSIVSRAVPSRSTLPVLSNILLTATSGSLTLAATNLEIGITTSVDADVSEEGAITLPAKLFVDLVRQSPSALATLALSGSATKAGGAATKEEMIAINQRDTVRYECGTVKANIKGIAADEFPAMPQAEGEGLRIPAALLSEMASQTVFAAAADDSRPILTGISMDFQDGKLQMYSTDGYRLSVRSADTEEGVGARIIVPARALDELARIAEGEFVGVSVTENRNQIIFTTGNVTLASALIEGNFPDVQRLIPKSHETIAKIDAKVLARAVQRCNIFARDEHQIIKLQVGTKSLTVSAEVNQIGDNEEMLIAVVEGEPVTICLNAKYLLDALGKFGGEVAIGLNSSTTPALLRGSDDSDFIHVIMPMHINREGK